MLNHLKEKLAAEWLETRNDIHKIRNWFITNEKEIIMTLFARIEAAEAEIASLKATPATGVTPADVTAAVAPVEAKVDALAALVGTPSTPAA